MYSLRDGLRQEHRAQCQGQVGSGDGFGSDLGQYFEEGHVVRHMIPCHQLAPPFAVHSTLGCKT